MHDHLRPRAILFGAIGTLAETAEIEREAFNRAFAECGLDWHWDRETYLQTLAGPAGERRIADHAALRGEAVDVGRVHRAKVAAFADAVRPGRLPARPGVVETVASAQAYAIPVGLATTAAAETVELVLNGLSPQITRDAFAFVGTRDKVLKSKPHPDIYDLALAALGVSGGEALAIEDTPDGAAAALAAGIKTYAFPGIAAEGKDFGGVMDVLDRLEPERLLALDPAAEARPIMM